MKIEKAALLILASWIKTKTCLLHFGLNKVGYEDKTNFIQMCGAIQASKSIQKLHLEAISLDEDFHGFSLGKLLIGTSTIIEFDLYKVKFRHPKSFFDMC